MLQAAAEDHGGLSAVVSEGAGARSYAEDNHEVEVEQRRWGRRVAPNEKLASRYAALGGERATHWPVPDDNHIGGITERPALYERRSSHSSTVRSCRGADEREEG